MTETEGCLAGAHVPWFSNLYFIKCLTICLWDSCTGVLWPSQSGWKPPIVCDHDFPTLHSVMMVAGSCPGCITCTVGKCKLCRSHFLPLLHPFALEYNRSESEEQWTWCFWNCLFICKGNVGLPSDNENKVLSKLTVFQPIGENVNSLS